MGDQEKNIKTLFVISIVALASALLSVQTVLHVSQMESGMELQVREMLEAEIGNIAGIVNQRLARIEQKTAGLALSVSNLKEYDTDVMFGIADGYIRSDVLIYGSGFWFEPNEYRPGLDSFGPYHYKGPDGNIHLTMVYNEDSYGYRTYPWYQNAIGKNGAVAWTGPYVDVVTDITMLSSVCAFRKEDREAGVVTVTVGITELEEYIRNITVGEHGYAFLLSQEGFYLASRDSSKDMKLKITDEEDASLAGIGRQLMEATDVLCLESNCFGEEAYIITSPLCIDNMRLVLVAPKAEYLEPIERLVHMSIGIAVVVMLLLCLSIVAVFNRYIGKALHGMMENLRLSRDRYKRKADLDQLTQLYNKNAMEQLGKHHLSCIEENKIITLYVIDLDHFKEANDTHGHQFGDEVLKTFAANLKKIFRASDAVGRFGGDEFLVLIIMMPNEEVVLRKAKEIHQMAREVQVNGVPAGITASIGIAVAPDQGKDYETLFQAADKALYTVKKNGRDGYSLHPPEILR